jgi:hypothetical protein
VGGRGVIPLWWDLVCLGVLSLAVFIGAMTQSRSPIFRGIASPRGTGNTHAMPDRG